MTRGRKTGWPLWLVLVLLALLHFYVRPRFYGGRGAPDFLLLALLIVSLRSRPGVAALTGFFVGLLTDTLTPVRVGAGAFSHTVVAYLASWGRSVFFPDNVLVNGVVFAAGTFVRNLLLLLAMDFSGTSVLNGFAPNTLLQAVTTAVAGAVVTLGLRPTKVDLRFEP